MLTLSPITIMLFLMVLADGGYCAPGVHTCVAEMLACPSCAHTDEYGGMLMQR